MGLYRWLENVSGMDLSWAAAKSCLTGTFPLVKEAASGNLGKRRRG